MKSKPFLGIAFLLTMASLMIAISPVQALIPVEAEDTDYGSWTWAWAWVYGTWDPKSWSYTNTWHDHASGTPGTQGSCAWWVQESINYRWYDQRGLIVGAASETNTYPYGGSLDAHAYAAI